MLNNTYNNISGALVLIAVTIAFSILFEPRYRTRTYLMSLIPFLAIMFASNFYLIFTVGFGDYGKYTLFTATLPSCIYFFITSKSRDGRFFFTFCLVDTMAIWFSMVTGFFDYFLHTEGMLNFHARLILFPIILICMYRYLRKPYIELTHTVDKGWWLLTAMTSIVYILLIMLASVPVSLRQRPDDIPLAIVISIFLPIVYTALFYILLSQKKLNEFGTLAQIFESQNDSMEKRATEIRNTENAIRIERHDMKHHLKAIEELTLMDEKDKVLEYIGSAQQILDESSIVHYCSNQILDAIISSYCRKAEMEHIEVETHLNIPEKLPIPDVEFATVFGNALDNAIKACMFLPREKRHIKCTCIMKPTLMFSIENPYEGNIEFDDHGLPVSKETGHGIGTKSILAFCNKHDATYVCTTDDNTFHLMLSL